MDTKVEKIEPSEMILELGVPYPWNGFVSMKIIADPFGDK